ncbi:selenocysteine synthase [Terriglobus aquaticus]|uniref:Selenocysteine synthase n=1 Tax=Terriglobus aquaticus TaxID=940139 RepID=A0ABW9KKY2_9BACT|nr:selenocysteine synthase [Terriglobus aquaticus]
MRSFPSFRLHPVTRRGFVGALGALAASLRSAGAAAQTAPAAAIAPAGVDYYDELGVTKIINAAGTYTALTAACMPPEVVEAVRVAALHPVRLHDLQQKAGEYLAQRLRCEGAVVTCGASSAITLATAACLQAANPKLQITDMPQNLGTAKKQVIVQRAHRYGYDHAIFTPGARITEVLTMDDYKRACGAGDAVMTNFFNAAEDEIGPEGPAQIGREEWLRVAHDYGIPCHIDAAADMPPISNLWKYTGMGFDLVSFSGGKGIRGPQNAGVLLGKKRLTDLAHANNNPNDGVCRGMKVAKEQIVGMVAAVDWVLSHTEEQMQGNYQERADLIASTLRGLPGVRTETVTPHIANHVPHLLVRVDPAVSRVPASAVLTAVRAGTPSIELNPNSCRPANQGIPSDANTLVVGVWMLQPGEDRVVGRALRTALLGNSQPTKA